jgi:carboxyl-terminal processing protease
MSRKNLLIVFILFLLVAPALARNLGKPTPVTTPVASLNPTPAEEEAEKYISQFLLQNHFRKVTINDSLSQEIFTRFVENLDGNKNYFTAKEIDSLRIWYGHRIDEEFLAGKSESGFAIYNFFLKRARDKMSFMKAVADTVQFNFSVPETLDLDRKGSQWPADTEQLVNLWKKELKYQWLNLKFTGENKKPIRSTIEKNLTSRLNLLNRQKPDDAFQAYNNAITTSFDPHTNYFSPDEYENFQIDMSRSLEGIGAKLLIENEYTVVNEVIPGGPAFRGKFLKKGDKIINVGQGQTGEFVDVIGWRINDVVKLIRGKKGTLVRLKILPANQGGRGPAKVVQIVRDKINLEDQAAQKSVIMQDGRKIGVITIPSFYLDFEGQQKNTGGYNSTTRDVSRIIEQLVAEHVDGIVVDLRDNGGGSLEESVNVTGLFIPSGPVVQISNSRGENLVLKDNDSRVQYGGPLAVLVNRYSASASEIFAAAIQDYGRGVIIGERTFGKGTVQSLIKLTRPFPSIGKAPELGEIKLTIAKFYRISGESTQHKGVVPDITMPSMIDAKTIGEDTYKSSLPWSTIAPTLFRPVASVTPNDIDLLRLHFKEHSAKNPKYQSYLHDIEVLDQIRLKKSVSLQETAFKTETETIKNIEKQWVREPDTKKDTSKKKDVSKDVLLNETAAVVSELAAYKTGSH